MSRVVKGTGKLVVVEKVGVKKNVGLVRLNRTQFHNALCDELLDDLCTAIDQFEGDSDIGSIIITGTGDIFAAGGDIVEMKALEFHQAVLGGFPSAVTRVSKCKKPIIAAVNGKAVGGGHELVMMCDITYASDAAVFGQPEILVGVLPGAGGTQRLTRAVGKSKAMEYCLTGAYFSAAEAERLGLVSKVFPPDQLLPETIKMAEKISSLSKIAVAICKESVNKAYEVNLEEGLNFERRMFHLLFATQDKMEGMAAFMEKRAAKWQDK